MIKKWDEINAGSLEAAKKTTTTNRYIDNIIPK